jgi:hypothetical protein
VLGHFKLVVILLTGMFILGEDSNVVRLAGTVMAFVGIVAYTEMSRHLKEAAIVEAAAGSAVQPSPKEVSAA